MIVGGIDLSPIGYIFLVVAFLASLWIVWNIGHNHPE